MNGQNAVAVLKKTEEVLRRQSDKIKADAATIDGLQKSNATLQSQIDTLMEQNRQLTATALNADVHDALGRLGSLLQVPLQDANAG